MARKAGVGNGHVKNGQDKGKAKLSRRRQQKNLSATFGLIGLSRKLATIGITFAVLGCLAAIGYRYYYPPNELIRMSIILRNHANTALQTIEQKYKFDAYILNDPLADVIKTKLRPVQERIASLKTQCAQYEKMEQIPGGPTSFIQSSLHELNTDIEQRMLDLNAEALAILRDYLERGHAMVKDGTEMVSTSALRINDNHIKMLTFESVFFIPIGDIPTEELEKAKKEVNLELLINMVEELASMYEALEEVGIKLGLISPEDIENLPDEDYDKIFPYLHETTERRQRIAEFKEKNNKYLQLFQELSSNQVRAMTAAMASVRENDEKRRQPYLNLHMAVMKDIKNLKIRIDNLKYAYAKRRTIN